MWTWTNIQNALSPRQNLFFCKFFFLIFIHDAALHGFSFSCYTEKRKLCGKVTTCSQINGFICLDKSVIYDLFTHVFIHFLLLVHGWVVEATGLGGNPDSFSTSSRETQGIARPEKIHSTIPPGTSESVPESPPRGTCLRTSRRRRLEHPNQIRDLSSLPLIQRSSSFTLSST